MNKRREKLEQDKKNWEEEKDIILEEIDLEEEKEQVYNKKKKKIDTTKLIILVLFINTALIEIFTGFVTLLDIDLAYKTGSMVDFSPITTLISAIVGQVIGFAIYAAKAAKENTKGGITYQNMMNQFNTEQAQLMDEEEDDDDDDDDIAG